MFKAVKIRASYDNNSTYVGGQLYRIFYTGGINDLYICLMSGWTMGSCAARSLFQFDGGFVFNEERTEKFFEFLDNVDVDLYNSRNIYLFLSNWQLNRENNTNLLSLVEDLETIDTFKNVGNGGDALMSLFRWVSPRINGQEDEEEEAEDF